MKDADPPIALASFTSAPHLPPLHANEFPEFCQLAHSIVPYPWQLRLAKQVFETRQWPSLISLPCGVGRCVMLDVAVFHLALEADDANRRACMRMVHVLDRWTVQNFFLHHARQLADCLRISLNADSEGDVVTRVAKRLSFLSESATPLAVRQMLMSAPLEGDWAASAHQPTILCSMVDAVGSRLLFRAYGTSASMYSLNAGLLGVDCLILLDDARSEAFRDTLLAIGRLRQNPWTACQSAPWAAVDIQVARSVSGAFSLNEDDFARLDLVRRLHASKPTHLRLLKARSAKYVGHAQEIVEHALQCSGINNGRRGLNVAIVVNSLRLARACMSELESRLMRREDANAVLLVGRSREARSEAAGHHERLIGTTDKKRSTLFVVATQCVEAGPDYDFDVLVSQIASLDALQPRFARLNRRGTSQCSEGHIVACRDEVRASAYDPIYCAALRNTWKWLVQQASPVPEPFDTGDLGVLDFGSHTVERRLQTEVTEDLVRASRKAPILTPAYLNLLSHTSPIPAADPEVALFLHGAPESGDVAIVWRDDVVLDTNADVAQSRMMLEALPPRPEELLPVPLAAARAWLREEQSIVVCDLQGAISTRHEDQKTYRTRASGRPALRWCGPLGGTQRIFPHGLRAGDLIVVPRNYGGLDEVGWAASAPRVPPAALQSATEGAASRALRLHPSLLRKQLASSEQHLHKDQSVDEIWSAIWQTFVDTSTRTDGVEVARRLSQIPYLPKSWSKQLRRLARSRQVRVVTSGADDTAVLHGGLLLIDIDPSVRQTEQIRAPTSYSYTELGEPPLVVPPVTLREFSQRFEEMAKKAVTSVFPAGAASDIILAARFSVLGHRDPRYQGYLRGGDQMADALGLEPLASATVLYESPEESREARVRVDLPEPWLPHVESVRLASLNGRLDEARDRLLVLWLIGSLCGTGRPILTHCDPAHAGPWSLDVRIEGLDWTELYNALVKRYGWWGLASMEAVLRLAQHRAWDHSAVGIDQDRIEYKQSSAV